MGGYWIDEDGGTKHSIHEEKRRIFGSPKIWGSMAPIYPRAGAKWGSVALGLCVTHALQFETYILPKFLPGFKCLKGLARTLRDTLFSKGGALYAGTPDQSSRRYNPILKAYDDSIWKN